MSNHGGGGWKKNQSRDMNGRVRPSSKTSKQVNGTHADRIRKHIEANKIAEQTLDFFVWVVWNKKWSPKERVECAKQLADICGLKNLPAPLPPKAGDQVQAAFTGEAADGNDETNRELEALLSRSKTE